MISIFDRAKFRKVQSIEDFLVEIDVFLAKTWNVIVNLNNETMMNLN